MNKTTTGGVPDTANLVVRLPVTMQIGDLPAGLTDLASMLAYGPRAVEAILKEAGVSVRVDRELAAVAFHGLGFTPVTVRADGTAITGRQTEVNDTQVMISEDHGAAFRLAATFANADLASRFARAWQQGDC